MPPYFSVDISFDKSLIKPNYVERLYQTIFSAGYPFKQGYGWDTFEELPLDEIIKINQEKLENSFKLGYTQHCKHDYIQILFDSSCFSHMRGFFRLYGETPMFSIIVYEDEILKEEGSLYFIEDQLTNLMHLATFIWESDLASAIQSSPENGGFANLENIQNGTADKIVALPFAIIDNISFHKYRSSQFTYLHLNKYFKDLYFKKIENDGIFIRQY